MTSAVIIAVPMSLTAYWAELLLWRGFAWLGAIIGFVIGGWVLKYVLGKYLLIYNPEWTAYVTQNMFAGTMVPYGPGLHPSYLWEARNKSNNYSLRVITRPFEVGVSTTTARVTIKGEYEYAIDLSRIARAIGVDESTIENGITAFIDSFLTGRCASQTADQVRSTTDALNLELANEFMRTTTQVAGNQSPQTVVTFGDNYGFRTVSVVIDRITLPEDAQKTRDALDEAAQLNAIMLNLYGMDKATFDARRMDGTITQEDADKMLNRAMAVSKNATLDVRAFEISGVGGAGGLGAAIAGMFGGGQGGGQQNQSGRSRNTGQRPNNRPTT